MAIKSRATASRSKALAGLFFAGLLVLHACGNSELWHERHDDAGAGGSGGRSDGGAGNSGGRGDDGGGGSGGPGGGGSGASEGGVGGGSAGDGGGSAGDGGGSAGAGGSGASGAGGSGSGGNGGSAGGAGSGGAAGEAGEGGAGDSLLFTEPPTLRMSSDPRTPLYADLSFATNRKTRARITAHVGTESFSHDFDDLSAKHELTLLHFIAGERHRFDLRVEDEGGEVLTHAPELEVAAPALPADFPALAITAADPNAMEPGVTLIRIPTLDQQGAYIVMLDALGRVVWFHYDPSRVPVDLRRLGSGNLLLVDRSLANIVELDMRGTVVRHFSARGPSTASAALSLAGNRGAPPTVVDTDSFHHDVQELENGNLLALTSEVRALANYPTSAVDPTPRTDPLNVVGDAVLEFSPLGEVLGRWSLLDLLDPYRVQWNSFGSGWQGYYGDPTNIDWSHSNAIVIDPRDGAFIVSIRNQDAIVKFTREGELVWILSDPINWDARFSPHLLAPLGASFSFPYAQHAPELTPRGTLLVFDNGGQRASPPDPGLSPGERYSRAVEFAIDEAALTVETLWDYGSNEEGESRFYSEIVGDVDELPTTGNILVNIGGILDRVEGEPSAIIREVTHTTPAQVLFELQILDDNPNGLAARQVYRAERLPDVYP